MHVDRSVEGVQRMRFEDVHQRIARHDAPGVLGEGEQDSELVAGQRPCLAVETYLSRAAVDLQSAEAQQVGFDRPLPASQNGPQAGEQLSWLERFRQVVVRAKLEADDTVH